MKKINLRLNILSILFVIISSNFAWSQNDENIVVTAYDANNSVVVATESIRILPNFHVTAGSTFSAKINKAKNDDELHWATSTSYGEDENGNQVILSQSKSYFDVFGKVLQSQGKSIEHNAVFASQPVYDHNGKATLSTLAAPINSTYFAHIPGFITNSTGDPYDADDFDNANTGSNALGEIDNPSPVGDAKKGTLGWYYSGNNNIESKTPITDYPYARGWTEEHPDPKLSISAGAGDAYRMGAGHTSMSTKEPISATDLDHYYSLRQHFTSVSTAIEENKGYKSINYVEGKQSIVYSDAEGKTVMTASENNAMSMDYSYTYYNDMGQVVATIAPRGVNLGSSAYPQFVTTYEYDHRGLLIETTATDEGTSRYLYSDDGKIRFSQNSAQQSQGAGTFSYTNYDYLGRLIESGEYSKNNGNPGETIVGFNSPEMKAILNFVGIHDGLTDDKNSMTRIYYDTQPTDYPTDANHPKQNFLYGQVAKTSNNNTTTWYSYDEFGRLEWMKQDINGLGIKTVDYTYDFVGNVLKVAYQIGETDAFFHHYSYDKDQRLTKVETSTDDITRTLNAKYEYYYHGPLKRVELGGDLQGIDYVYTITGALKSINHADNAYDPGKDGQAGEHSGFDPDVFGMTLSYYDGDYTGAGYSAGSQTVAGHNDYYTGAIKAQSWFNSMDGGTPRTYAYQYDHTNQLSQASWGNMTGSSGSYGFAADAASAHQVAIGGYDSHGNIGTLSRKDDAGASSAQYQYDYISNTNQLDKIRDNGSVLTNYTYNAIGQMTAQSEGGQTMYLKYDAYGNMTQASASSNHTNVIMKLYYDDKGMRVKKESYTEDHSAIALTTWYVRDAAGNLLTTYVDEGAGASVGEVPVYGASRIGAYKPATYAYWYEINDHLGNVRAILTGQPIAPNWTLTYESGNTDMSSFESLDNLSTLSSMNHTTGGSKSQKLSSGYLASNRIGSVLPITVNKGDKINVSVYAKYIQESGGADPVGAIGSLLSAALSGTAGTPAMDGAISNSYTNSGSMITNTVYDYDYSSSNPMAFLNLLFIPENIGTTVDEDHFAFAQVPSSANASHAQLIIPEFEVPGKGVVIIYLSNESIDFKEIYFDDLVIDITEPALRQSTDYYPFGLPMADRQLTYEPYRFSYQGQYAEKDEETGYNSFQLRQYDARFGRWMSTDPYGQYHSPYAAMGNIPNMSVDPDGGFSTTILSEVVITGSRLSTQILRTAAAITPALTGVLSAGKGFCPKCPDPQYAELKKGAVTTFEDGTEYILDDPSLGRDGWIRNNGVLDTEVVVTPGKNFIKDFLAGVANPFVDVATTLWTSTRNGYTDYFTGGNYNQYYSYKVDQDGFYRNADTQGNPVSVVSKTRAKELLSNTASVQLSIYGQGIRLPISPKPILNVVANEIVTEAGEQLIEATITEALKSVH